MFISDTMVHMHLDHSVNVSQSHRRSLFRVQLTADASFLLQITGHLDRRINICAATVETIYTTSTVEYRSNTGGGVPDHDSQRKKNTFSHFTWKIN